MSSRILQSITRSAPTLTRSFQQRITVLPTITSRTYAVNPSSSSASQNNSNTSNPTASSSESQDINASAATRGSKDQDTGSLAKPVSRPQDGGMGATEETTTSQDQMSHDPKESAESKKEKTLEFGQKQPLDAADK